MVAKNSKARRIINLLIFMSALTAIYADFNGYEMLFIIFKPLTTSLVIGLLFLVKSTRLSRFRSIMIIALGCCLLGDIFLLNDDYFVLGLGSFLIGHLLFASGFIELERFHFNWISLIAFLTIGTVVLFWLQPDLGDFELPVTIYIVVIVFMAWQGVGLFINQQRMAYALIAIAVLLFMFSDTMIAFNKFRTPFKLSGMVILSTYWLSISLIANGAYAILNKGKTKA